MIYNTSFVLYKKMIEIVLIQCAGEGVSDGMYCGDGYWRDFHQVGAQ